MIFVTVGASLPFDRLIQHIDESVAPKIKEKIIAQIHKSAKFTPKNIEYFRVTDKEKYDDYIKKSDLVITHAGMGVIIDCLKLKKKFILVPRDPKRKENWDYHQYEICSYLKEKYNDIEVLYNFEHLFELIDKNLNKNINYDIDFKKNQEKLKRNLKNYLSHLKNRKIMVVSSSGGHFRQMMELLDVLPDDITLITNYTKTNIKGVNTHIINVTYEEGIILKTIFIAPFLLIKYKPDIIITNGGGELSIPFSYFGKILGKKIIFIETISRVTSKSAAAKYIYPIADKFIIQWEKNLKNYGKKAEYWGSVL
jgi:beta-1,4-N-acetylglucosaminyltransferase